MPVCRHCGSRISKVTDKYRCPVCGEINPLEGVSSDTVEITGNINISSQDYSDYKPRKKKTFLLLSSLIGWTGVQFFYLYYKRAGFIWLAVNFVLLAGGFSAFFFGVRNLPLAIIVPLVIVYIANIVFGVVIYNKPSFKDGNENLLR